MKFINAINILLILMFNINSYAQSVSTKRCVDGQIDALRNSKEYKEFKREMGFEKTINADQIQEFEANCKNKNSTRPKVDLTGEKAFQDMIDTSKFAIETYKSKGLLELISTSKQCYANIEKFKVACIYYDLAARRIDEMVIKNINSKGGRYLPHEYFNNDFSQRANQFYLSQKMDRTQAVEHISRIERAINRIVDTDF